MHTKSGAGIHFTDTAASFPIRFGYVIGQKIDAADIETDGVDGSYCHLPIVRMYGIGDIDGSAAGG